MVRRSIQPAVFALVARSCIAAQLVTRNALPSDALSDNCVNALVADVSCAPGVVGFGSGAHYTTEALEESCTSACRNALGDYQASAAAACTKSDVFQITESRTAPASFIPTLLYYQFNKACIQDDGRWCQDVLYEISGGNATNITTQRDAVDMCDDCIIKVLQFQAGSPIYGGYQLQDDYSSLTSSCSKTGFPLATSTVPFSRPDQTTTPIPIPSPSCTGSMYTIQPGDTCQSISKSQSVGTAWLLLMNDLEAFCADFPMDGELCIQNTCTTYTLKADDTCRSLSQDKRISQTQLLTWNPILGSGCRHLYQSVGDEICISPPGIMGWMPPSKTTATVTTTSTPTTAPVPTDIAEGTNIKCAEYYDVQKGDYCNKLVLKFGISLDDFLFLNSGVNQNCTNLYADESYCVAPVGPINEYPGHPGYIPPTSSVPDVPYSNLPKATYTPPPITGLPQHLPLANGTRSDCFAYANGADLDVDITYTYYKSVCDALAHGWGVTLKQLQNWNPSLDTSSENCAPEEGYRYCMKGYAITVTGGPPPPTQTPSSVSSGSTPSSTQLPIRDGTITDCNKYEAVVSPMTCASVLEENGITISQFYQWNPEVGEQCTNLWLGYRYCVSGPTAISTSTTTSPTNGPQPPGPTQAGEPDNCNKWHLVESGDNCYSVAKEAGITLDQFYKWNPAVKNDCAVGFWLGEAYCIGVTG